MTKLRELIWLNRMPEDNKYLFYPVSRAFESSFIIQHASLPTLKSHHELKHIFNLSWGSLEDSSWELYARLLGEIFRNVTIIIPVLEESLTADKWNQYSSPIIVMAPTGKYDYGHFHLHKSSLMFVSCGPTDIKTLSLANLLRIFDCLTWIYLIVALVLVIIVSRSVASVELSLRDKLIISIPNFKNCFAKLTEDVFWCLKPLFEQGDPIQLKFLEYSTLRFLFTTYLFAAIVLSNAFKNENITELTLPRSPIPLDTFPLLLQHHFKIYARAAVVAGYTRVNISALKLPHFVRTLVIEYGLMNQRNMSHDSSMILKSELYNFAKEYISARTYKHSKYSMYEIFTTFLNNTEVVPFWKDLLYPSSNSEADACSICRDGPCDILRFCNNTAIFLPKVEATTKYHALKKLGKSAFLSKDEIHGGHYSLMFLRWVDQKILRRLDGLRASGMLEWWTEITGEYIPRIKYNSFKVKLHLPGDLFGNILLVFAVLGCGLSVALLEFLVEIIVDIMNITLKKSTTVKSFKVLVPKHKLYRH